MLLHTRSNGRAGKGVEHSFYPEVTAAEASWWLERTMIQNRESLVLVMWLNWGGLWNRPGHLVALDFKDLCVKCQDLTKGSLKTILFHFLVIF